MNSFLLLGRIVKLLSLSQYVSLNANMLKQHSNILEMIKDNDSFALFFFHRQAHTTGFQYVPHWLSMIIPGV